MGYKEYLLLLVVLVSLILGLIIFLKNRRNSSNILLGVFSISLAIWAFGMFEYVRNPVDLIRIELWTRILYSAGTLAAASLLGFSLSYPKNKTKQLYIYFITPLIIFIPLIISTDLIVSGIAILPEYRQVLHGVLYPLYFGYFFIYILTAIALLLRDFFNATGIEKLQLKYILIGFISASTMAGIFNMIIPAFWGNFRFAWLGPIFLLIMLYSFFYAILRYRLMDIRVVLKRSAVFTALVVIITTLYALFAYLISVYFQGLIGTQSMIFNGIFTAVLVVISFEPLKNKISKWTDTFLFKGVYNPQTLLAEITGAISSTLVLKKVLETINQKLYSAFRATLFSIYLYDDTAKCFSEAAFVGKRVKPPVCLSEKEIAKYQSVLKKYSRLQNVIVTDELKKENEIKKDPQLELIIKDLDANGVSVTLPVFMHNQPIAIFFLGPKKSGDYYTQQDLNVLEIVAGQSATAIENSSLYKEVNDLNKNLQKKVDEQTKDIVEKNKKMEVLLKAKSEFLDIASHQLRTPVSVICGTLDMFKSGSLDQLPKEKKDRFINNAFSKGVKLNAVINDILDASDLDEKELELKETMSELNLSDLVGNIIEYNKPEAEQKKVKINADVEKGIMVNADKKYLEQAINNLVDNAIKYTPENKEVFIKLAKTNKQALLEVKDTGIGIPQKEQGVLFQKFSRASNAKEMHTDGSGLGLFIVKKVINAHPGAKVWYESKEGQGTTFYIQLLSI